LFISTEKMPCESPMTEAILQWIDCADLNVNMTDALLAISEMSSGRYLY
jgi:hypothetical protein